jgi:phospholipid transport system transporter-binding protein
MSQPANNHIKLSGAVVIDSVGKLLDASRAACAASDVTLDFSAATDLDSSALALILEFRRVSETAQKRLSVSNIPASLKTLADLYGVTDLIAATP